MDNFGGLFLLAILCLCVQVQGEQVCYHLYGCFNGNFPYNNTGELPQEPGFINTQFKLFTRSNTHIPILINHYTFRGFNPGHKSKILIHGFLDDSHIPWVNNAKDEFLRKEDMNIIIVDWGRGAGFPYTQAAANTRIVGIDVANFVNAMVNHTSTNIRKIHVIGHSLGAHVAGYAGQRIEDLDRITGLDPAKPNFIHTENTVHLDKSDAKFVDVIHTDGSPFDTVGGYGMITAVGHVDFYPNGGIHQPGCGQGSYTSLIEDAFSHGFERAETDMACSHNRASALFIASINGRCTFTAYPCQSYEDFKDGRCLDCGNRFCPSLGIHADRYKSRGKFYLFTNIRAPFCGNHYYIQINLKHLSYRQPGTIKVKIGGTSGETQSVEFQSGTVPESLSYTKLYFSSVNIGSITDVSVSFQSDSSGFWFSSARSITVKRIIAISLKRNLRMYFCARRMIKNGKTVTFRQGSRQPC